MANAHEHQDFLEPNDGFYPKYIQEQARRLGLPVAVYERMLRLRDVIPKKHEQVGGLMGQVSHLARYSWEGIGFAMLAELFWYFMMTMVLPPNMQEMAMYDQLPDDLKYEPNAKGVYPTLYRSVVMGDRVQLTNEIVPHEEATEYDVWANGYMPNPTVEMGLRNRYNELMDTMMEVDTVDPVLRKIFNTIKEQTPKQDYDHHGMNPAEYKFVTG